MNFFKQFIYIISIILESNKYGRCLKSQFFNFFRNI